MSDTAPPPPDESVDGAPVSGATELFLRALLRLTPGEVADVGIAMRTAGHQSESQHGPRLDFGEDEAR